MLTRPVSTRARLGTPRRRHTSLTRPVRRRVQPVALHELISSHEHRPTGEENSREAPLLPVLCAAGHTKTVAACGGDFCGGAWEDIRGMPQPYGITTPTHGMWCARCPLLQADGVTPRPPVQT